MCFQRISSILLEKGWWWMGQGRRGVLCVCMRVFVGAAGAEGGRGHPRWHAQILPYCVGPWRWRAAPGIPRFPLFQLHHTFAVALYAVKAHTITAVVHMWNVDGTNDSRHSSRVQRRAFARGCSPQESEGNRSTRRQVQVLQLASIVIYHWMYCSTLGDRGRLGSICICLCAYTHAACLLSAKPGPAAPCQQ